MDFLRLFAEQERQGFADLAGSEGQAAIRELHVSPRAGDRFGVRVVLAKSFLPPISLDVVIDKQPSLPGDPVLALTLSGMGGLLRFAGPVAGFLKALPPGVRMEGDRVFVDLRAVLAPHGLTSILNYVEEVLLSTEEGRLLILFRAAVRGSVPVSTRPT